MMVRVLRGLVPAALAMALVLTGAGSAQAAAPSRASQSVTVTVAAERQPAATVVYLYHGTYFSNPDCALTGSEFVARTLDAVGYRCVRNGNKWDLYVGYLVCSPSADAPSARVAITIAESDLPGTTETALPVGQRAAAC